MLGETEGSVVGIVIIVLSEVTTDVIGDKNQRYQTYWYKEAHSALGGNTCVNIRRRINSSLELQIVLILSPLGRTNEYS
jgi:hypothetical protein